MTREEWLVQLGQALAAARKAAGLTQGQVAERVGVHRQTVYRWEQGEQAPDVWHWAVLRKCLLNLDFPCLEDPEARVSSRSMVVP